MIVRVEFKTVSDVTFASYLLELQEHANLMTATQMRKVQPKQKYFSLIGLKNSLERLLNTLFPSEKSTKNCIENIDRTGALSLDDVFYIFWFCANL